VRVQFLGDSFDLVKQSLLRWLAPSGQWRIHPMFTHAVTDAEALAFESLMGAPLLSRSVLTQDTPRDSYLAPACAADGNVFLDPDTGLRLNVLRGKKAPFYLFLPELTEIVHVRPGQLTMVFDQSLPRGGEGDAVQAKLDVFREAHLYAVAYVSHAAFFVVSDERDKVSTAGHRILGESRLPPSRLLWTHAA
jgi:hypothetical protein